MPSTSVFALPERLTRKTDPALISDDERHFQAIARCLDESVVDLERRLDLARKSPDKAGQAAVERDAQVHRLGGELRMLRRYGLDLCLGHFVRDDGAPVYVGRLGLLDRTGTQLLLDWRSPLAEPFFGATLADPMGATRRRRYRWHGEHISDYWDEVFDTDTAGRGTDFGDTAFDDQSAFLAGLAASRSPRMRDVLGTIAADQDAVIRGGTSGALVVDGGPGTGKTVVALHRAAYLLYSDPRLRHGVLFVGPHEPYLAYVADVLPSLGEDSVRLCTLRDLVTEADTTTATEDDPKAIRLKESTRMVEAIETAVRFYEQPPTEAMTVATDWVDIALTAADWREAFDAPERGTPHNEAREQIWELLLTILVDKVDGTVPAAELRNSLRENDELRAALDNAWTLIDAPDLVGDLWSVPAYLRHCAPWLDADELRLLRRPDPKAWTTSDLPLLDAARHRLGDPASAAHARHYNAALAAEREHRNRVVDDLIAADDSELMVMTMLRGQDMQNSLIDEAALPGSDSDPLAGPFAHIVVDEAQELTDAQWLMLLRRCPSRSFTIVGDRAQARRGFTETWQERLGRVGLDRAEIASLSLNYRTPEEVMAEAEPVIRAALPDANVPVSVRASGIPVVRRPRADLDAVLEAWLTENVDGIACVVTTEEVSWTAGGDRIRFLTPELTKGLEFDLVVLIDPDGFGDGIEGAVDRYVAMTRATRELVMLT